LREAKESHPDLNKSASLKSFFPREIFVSEQKFRKFTKEFVSIEKKIDFIINNPFDTC
jgi:hypothetical protein